MSRISRTIRPFELVTGLAICAGFGGLAVAQEFSASDYGLRLSKSGDAVVFVPLAQERALLGQEGLDAVPLANTELAQLGIGLYALNGKSSNGSTGVGLNVERGDVRFALSAITHNEPMSMASNAAGGCLPVNGVLAIGALSSSCVLVSGSDDGLPGRVDSAFASLARVTESSAQEIHLGVAQINPLSRLLETQWQQSSSWAPLQPAQTASVMPVVEPRTVKSVGASSSWVLAPKTVLKLSAQYERSKDPLPELYPNGNGNLQSGALGLGLSRGNLSGSVVGRIVNRAGSGSASDTQNSGVDLGVIWKTPWNGSLSVGAQNVISRGKGEKPLKPDPSVERTPYVQYEQDL